ncbi:uncharacterized protein LOC5513831 [Nematostella vectensis]|uniref:uncharacterized protein LOC5513831 n=1 Tax=Nematostella vectensis TaxID=45351 RepID=UPI002076D942|nr:uncharacterized protein LOC5513831 [Nematostella vectensis]
MKMTTYKESSQFVILLGLIFATQGTPMSQPDRSCKNSTECSSGHDCHPFLHVCFKRLRIVNDPAPKPQNTNCVCKSTEYCHPVLNRCLPKQAPPLPPKNTNRASTPSCTSSSECGSNQYCHVIFKRCLTKHNVPTSAPRGRSLRRCHDNNGCNQGEYCHDVFKFCLEVPTGYSDPATPTPRGECAQNSDCMAGQYCHDIYRVCLTPHNVSNNAVPRKRLLNGGRCDSDSDCLSTEYCFFRPPQRSIIARHRRLCSNALNCPYRARDGEKGFCTRRIVKSSTSCTVESDCEAGMTCLTKLKACMKYRQKGDLCLIQPASFVSPCAPGLMCKPTNKSRLLKGRRLERKLQIPKFIRRMAIVKNLVRKRYQLGRCHDATNAF